MDPSPHQIWKALRVFLAVASGGFPPREGEFLFEVNNFKNLRLMKMKKTRTDKW